MFACIHAPGSSTPLIDCARAFSPLVESTAPDTVVLDMTGLEHLFGPAAQFAEAMAQRAFECGVEANVAVASNPDAAIHAARGLEGITVIPPGAEAGYLARLPLHLLAPSPELAETFERWGIRAFHDLAALPEAGIADRLGDEGVRLHQLARGAAHRPLQPLDDAAPPEATLDLEYPVTLLEPLLFILSRLLHDLCGRMDAATAIRVRLALEDGSEHVRALDLPVPVRNPKTFLKLLQLDLESHPPCGPVVKVCVGAEPARPRVAQHGLFIPVSPEPEKLELTLARIGALVGEEGVGTPVLLDTHRPGAFRMEKWGRQVQHTTRSGARQVQKTAPHSGTSANLGLRVFRPPKPAQVFAQSGSPAHIAAPGIRGNVVCSAGPWRTSGDWWKSERWNRDEWDIALHNGGLYRIYCDRETGAWFIEGSYD
jgi:protein ImuB